MDVLTTTALVLAAGGALFVFVLVVRRLELARIERSREDLETRLRPVAVALIEGESETGSMGEEEAQVLASILTRYARQLSGEARERITAFFERSGHIDQELTSLEDRRTWRRATAAFVLGDMGSRKAVQGLLPLLDDPEREVRAAAALSLGKLAADVAVKPLVEALAQATVPRSTASQALLFIGPGAVPGLRGLVHEPDAAVRAAAVELIGWLGGADEGSLLMASLRDPSAEVRAKAAHALGRLGAEEAAAALRSTLDDRVPFVRIATARALGMVRDAHAVAPLLDQARHDRFEPAQAAARALSRINPEAVEAAAREGKAGRHLHEAADILATRAA